MNRPAILGADRELTIADLNFDPPRFSESELQRIAGRCFDIGGEFSRLEGERDQNCRITNSNGEKFVLKISGAGEDPLAVDFQIKALQHIARKDENLPVPRVVPGRGGECVHRVAGRQGTHHARMLTWLDGIPYQNGPPASGAGLQQVGSFLARLCRALEGFSHPAEGGFMPWDITNGLLFRPQLRDLLSAGVREFADPVLRRLEREVFPALDGLRKQVIHQDAHGANLLRASPSSEAVAGLIDFGDMVHGPVVCDLAVCLTDFLENAGDPEAIAAAMTRGFHSVIPLERTEIGLLLDLVMARLILILELFEFRRRNMDNPPEFVTRDQPRYFACLKKLAEADRGAFDRRVYEALK